MHYCFSNSHLTPCLCVHLHSTHAMQVCFLAPEHLCLTAGEQGQHKRNVLWKGLQQNNGKSEKWGCGSLPDPYWGRQFDFQRCLTSVASLKRKKKGGRRTDLYRCRGGNFCLLFPFCYQSGTLQADIVLFYGNKISVSCDPGSSRCWGHCWKRSRSLYWRLWRKAAVKAAWWKLTEERSSKMKNISICFFTFQNDVQMRYHIGGAYLCADWQLGIARIATANAACQQEERIRYPLIFHLSGEAGDVRTHIQSPASALLGFL